MSNHREALDDVNHPTEVCDAITMLKLEQKSSKLTRLEFFISSLGQGDLLRNRSLTPAMGGHKKARLIQKHEAWPVGLTKDGQLV